MRREYDFAGARSNPYARRLKRAVTLRLDEDTVAYFKELSVQTGLPYQTLINLYLRDCASSGRALRWDPPLRRGRSRGAGPGRQGAASRP